MNKKTLLGKNPKHFFSLLLVLCVMGVISPSMVTGNALDSGKDINYLKPVQPTVTGAKLERKLDMKIGSTNGQAIESPLFFTMELPSDIDLNKLTIKHHKDNGSEDIAFTQSGQTVSFKIDNFSEPQFFVSDGSAFGGTSCDDGYGFWMQVKEEIRKADDGDVIKTNAKGYDKMPWSVMAALRKNNGVSLVVRWDGKTVTIPAGKAQKKELGRVYWPLSKLAELYADIAEDAVLKPADGTNFDTGGPGGFVPVTGGGELIVLEAKQSAQNPLPDDEEPIQANKSVNSRIVTPPDAGFEKDVFSGTTDNPDLRQGGGFFFGAIVLQLAAGTIGILWFWKNQCN